MKRLSLHEWIPMLPWPVCPLAGHAQLGQNVVVGSMFVLRVTLGNVPRGVCLDPHFHCKRTIPRLSVELPKSQDPQQTAKFYVENLGATIVSEIGTRGYRLNLHGLTVNLTTHVEDQTRQH